MSPSMWPLSITAKRPLFSVMRMGRRRMPSKGVSRKGDERRVVRRVVKRKQKQKQKSRKGKRQCQGCFKCFDVKEFAAGSIFCPQELT